MRGLLVFGPMPNGPLGSDQPFSWRGKRNDLPVRYRQWSMPEIHFCAHSSRAQALWWADDSNPFPHTLFLVKARLFFIIRKSVTVYWIRSLQSFRLMFYCFDIFRAYETRNTLYFLWFCRTNILSWEVKIIRTLITTFFLSCTYGGPGIA